MKTFYKAAISIIVISVTFGIAGLIRAATTPALGQSATFAVLASTYTNTVGGTTITGNVGYTTGPAMAPTINGSTYSPPASTYTTAGTDQGAALSSLAAQPCTHTFPAGAVDLSTDTSHGTIGVYTPGVYCTTATSAASIGTGGIVLSGSGTYIFRIDGALTTVANSVVSSASSASACDVFWTPTGATTLGANSTFFGSDIDAAGITIGSTVLWTGRALAFGGTISTTTDTITVPVCAASVNANANTNVAVNTNTTAVTNTSVTTNVNGVVTTPALPNTGLPPKTSSSMTWAVLTLLGTGVAAAVIVRRKKHSFGR